MPKVSVIIPVYGVEKYIARCARSLFDQTLDDIEFIFVDDCTPDKSIEILKRIIEEYPSRKEQVRIIHHEKNEGLPIARQTGLEAATGDFIAHCDSDDWVDLELYRTMYNKAIEDQSDCVVCEYLLSDGISNKETYRACYQTERDAFIRDNLNQKVPWTVWNKLIKRGIYAENEFQYPLSSMGEDLVLTMQLLWYCRSISHIKTPYYYYFINPSSMTRQLEPEAVLKRFSEILSNLRIVENFYERVAPEAYKEEFLHVKYKQSVILYPIVKKDRRYYKIWRDTFPELPAYVIRSSSISIKDKLRYYLTYFHIL